MENLKKCEKIHVRTCGKLYVAGEYSVLTAGQSAIIKNVDIFMNAVIKFAGSVENSGKNYRQNEKRTESKENSEKEYRIFSDMFGYWCSLEYDKNYFLIQETVKTVNEYLKLHGISPRPFELAVTGKMEKDGKKYGIGSSGSVTVLVVKAMLELYSEYFGNAEENRNLIEKDTGGSKKLDCRNENMQDLIFKISSYVLLKLGDNGSMGDIACISYNSLISYRSFDRAEIGEKIKNESLESTLKMDWKYEIRELKSGIDCEFLAGWTKRPSISKEMINIVKSSIDKAFLEKSEDIAEKFRVSVVSGEKEKIKECINENGKILEKLNENIYSRDLKKLVEAAENLDICAKSSGAGGGDCGIAISFSRADSAELIKRWKESGIELIFRDRL